MSLSRRQLLMGMGTLPVLASATAQPGVAATLKATTLPDKHNFPFSGVYLNAAYVHPMGINVGKAMDAFAHERMYEVGRAWPDDNPRDAAVGLFARLINANPGDIAVVPSTMAGENLIVEALGLNASTGVVSDAYHFSLAVYTWLNQTRGVPLRVAAPRNNRIELADIEALIGPNTRLVAVTLVGSDTGFTHDLRALCKIAHAKGALVYADIIQAAGAMPIDVKDSGVDFCCAGTYKWMMGSFGTAFLYVRPDRLQRLKRSQVGWRQFKKTVTHVFPFDSPGSAAGEWELGSDTAGTFEVSTPDWCGLSVAIGSLRYVLGIGVDQIAHHRAPMNRRLQEALPKLGFAALTPADSPGPIVSFSCRDARARLESRLSAARIKIQLDDNLIRISPSVYNDMGDVERLIRVLSA
jgi:selenocysteine lyase/cysteine desulfurase